MLIWILDPNFTQSAKHRKALIFRLCLTTHLRVRIQMIKNKLRNIVFLTLPTILIFLCLLEIFFTYIIPAANFPYAYYNPEEKMRKYEYTK